MSTSPVLDPQVLAARLKRAAEAAASAGVDALLVSPGTDLRDLTGAAGESFERLTCLVVSAAGDRTALVVPKLEAPGYAGLPLAELGVEVVTWVDGDDP